MKYIDADRFRMELEKRLKNVRDYMNGAGMKYKGPKYFRAQGRESAYDALLNTIDSLQQEQPDFPTTDEQMKDFLATHPKIRVPEKYKNPDWLFKKQEQQEEPVSEDLEEEVKRYYSDNFAYISGDAPTLSILTNIARHFAEWQKAKMMEGAVEGAVYRYESYQQIATAIIVDVPKESLGNKVRIIILPKEE